MRELRTAAIAVVVMTLVLGLAYPLAMTGVAQVLFPDSSDGSLVKRDGKTVGSKLIGQDFSKNKGYFQSRPSVTDYNPSGTLLQQPGARTRRTSPTSSRASSTTTSSASAPTRRTSRPRRSRPTR